MGDLPRSFTESVRVRTKHVEKSHVGLGFNNDALRHKYAYNEDRKLVERMGRVSLELNVRIVVL